jgi:hypothetical protein
MAFGIYRQHETRGEAGGEYIFESLVRTIAAEGA